MLRAPARRDERRLQTALVTDLEERLAIGATRVEIARHLDLRASDDCGLSPQAWGHLCSGPGNGTAGAPIMNVTLALDALAP